MDVVLASHLIDAVSKIYDAVGILQLDLGLVYLAKHHHRKL
jgi:hypothetical protein